jgi:regulator of sigma E protease
MRLGDRIVSVNGKPVSYARDVEREVRDHPDETINVVVERDGQHRDLEILTETSRDYWLGISCVSATVESLQGGGMAWRAGFRAGDRIAELNGTPVRSIVEVEQLIDEQYGPVDFAVERASGTVHLQARIDDEEALGDFLFSLHCTSGNVLTWVAEGAPAWNGGLRAGDTITEVAGESVETWEQVRRANGSEQQEARSIVWERDGEVHRAQITPARNLEEPRGSMGCIFDRGKQRVRRYGVWGAVRTGVRKTYGTIGDTLLTIRGFFRREVSTRNLGGVVLIAYSSYRAAQEGIGKLLYLTAMISIALAFLNILPIPVLDGGHLLFVGIEKLRGKPVGEKVRMASQIVGLSLLILLLAYVVRNDILRLVSPG